MTNDKAMRIARVKERLSSNKELAPAQKLEQLDVKFGAGLGATKERAKLAKLLGKSEKPEKQEAPKAAITDEILAEIEAMNAGSSKKSKKKK